MLYLPDVFGRGLSVTPADDAFLRDERVYMQGFRKFLTLLTTATDVCYSEENSKYYQAE